jgi:RNA polymerase sigma-70 factor, ECF subfamily
MEDLLLLWRFKRGDSEALRRIYEKYVDDMMGVAASLLGDVNPAYDVVHDVFVSFAQSAEKVRLHGNLRSFLVTCVVNAARSRVRGEQRKMSNLQRLVPAAGSGQDDPAEAVVADEKARRMVACMNELPQEQREVVTMHIRGGMSFREIARACDASINTVQSRYRYGIEKLRSMLNGEVEP